MKIKYLIYLVTALISQGCTKQVPVIPFSYYHSFGNSVTVNNINVLYSNKGFYEAVIQEVDTVFSRAKITIFSSDGNLRGKPYEKIRIYFIDDFRFYYTKDAGLHEIDIKFPKRKGSNMGLYKLRKIEHGIYLVDLFMVKAGVKDSTDYEYGYVTLQFTPGVVTPGVATPGAGILEFQNAKYPLRISGEAFKNKPSPGFGPETLKKAEEDIQKMGFRNFETNDLDFKIQWHEVRNPITTKINGIEFDSVAYAGFTPEISRRYFLAGSLVFKEIISDDSTKKMISW